MTSAGDREGRGLASRAARYFAATTIAHAHEYVETGHVKLVDVAARSVVARVLGTRRRPYTVEVAAPITAPAWLRCACSCPVGERGEPCKHVYAVLRVLDQRRLDLGLEGDRARVETVEPWLDDPTRAVTRWDDLVDVAPEEPPAPAVARAPRPASAPAAPPAPSAEQGAGGVMAGLVPVHALALARPLAWDEHLHWLGQRPHRPRARAGDLELRLRVLAPVDFQGRPLVLPAHVTIELYRRSRRRGGDAGRGAPWLLHLDGTDPVDDARDQAALAALALGAPIVEPSLRDLPLDSLRATGVALRYQAVQLPAAGLEQVMPVLAATGRLGYRAADGAFTTLAWDAGPPYRLLMMVARAPGGLSVTGFAIRGDERVPLAAITAMFGAGCVAIGERLVRIDVIADLARWWAATGRAPLVVPRNALDRLLDLVGAAAPAPALELARDTGWTASLAAPSPRLDLEPAAGGGYTGTIRFQYGAMRRDARADGGLVRDPVEKLVHVVDRAAEREREAELHALLPAPQAAGTLRLPADELAALIPLLEARGWQVWLRAQRLRGGGRLAAVVRSGIDWFDVHFELEVGDEAVDGLALLDALRAGRELVRLRDGSALVLPPAWSEEQRLLLEQGKVVDGALRVPRSRAMILDLLLEALPAVDLDDTFRRLRDRLADFRGIAAAREPRGFTGTLRPYQREGLGWLAFLRELGFGGCLADDMGLGKTVQVLAALVGMARGRERRPSLVVAPKSVVWNWLDEAARFAPGLRTVEHGGAARARGGNLDDADLVITSYATLRLDIEHLARRSFAYVVLDEAQAIKNPESQVARAARSLRAEHRLALTGTPVENHLGDLASIFEVLNPGMLDGVAALRRLGDRRPPGPGELAPLARALRPFLLRRTKAEVLPDLPDRSEQLIKVRLEGAQRRFYDELREGYRASLLKRVEREGMGRSTMHVLEALLRLRQAACAPALVAAARARDGSAKLDALLEHVGELVAEGHKVLVFSQFTALLALVRARLDEAAIAHAYLDGATRDRAQQVARFQKDPECRVFAISLKAGGTGLNLTAASYVFLLDPWWNPAVEAQAIDRAHRLGQTRAVTAYRLIAEDTVEDKILALQDHKRALLDGLFAEDAGRLASLTAADLAVLLA